MSRVYFLAAPPKTPVERVVTPREILPKLTLESMSGSISIPLDDSAGWIRMPGATGLEMPPVEVISESQPGVDGSTVKEVRVLSRPVFLPFYGRAGTSHADFLRMKDQLRKLVDPKTGSFRIVGKTSRTTRELVVTYVSGLEGIDSVDMAGLHWGKFGLTAIAHQPFARALSDSTLEFRVGGTAKPFIGAVGGLDAPWPPVMASAAVIGNNMKVNIHSEVPLYPTIELVGPMSSFEGDLSPVVIDPDGSSRTIEDQEWYVNIPAGVPAAQTFKIVTDPALFSARLNGALAAGKISLGSTLRPFHPGQNVMNVTAPGSTVDTKIKLSWRDLFWSLW